MPKTKTKLNQLNVKFKLQDWQKQNMINKLAGIDAFLFDMEFELTGMYGISDKVIKWLKDAEYREIEKLENPELMVLYNLIWTQVWVGDTLHQLEEHCEAIETDKSSGGFRADEGSEEAEPEPEHKHEGLGRGAKAQEQSMYR